MKAYKKKWLVVLLLGQSVSLHSGNSSRIHACAMALLVKGITFIFSSKLTFFCEVNETPSDTFRIDRKKNNELKHVCAHISRVLIIIFWKLIRFMKKSSRIYGTIETHESSYSTRMTNTEFSFIIYNSSDKSICCVFSWKVNIFISILSEHIIWYKKFFMYNIRIGFRYQNYFTQYTHEIFVSIISTKYAM